MLAYWGANLVPVAVLCAWMKNWLSKVKTSTDGIALCLSDDLCYMVSAADQSGINASPDSLSSPEQRPSGGVQFDSSFFGCCTTDLSVD
eukprot:g27161.t1